MTAQPNILIRAEALTRVYEEVGSTTAALTDVSFEVAAGELVVVSGPSGSGKSTLLSLLAGLDGPTAGSAEIAGARMTGASEPEAARLRRDELGFVAQEFALVPMLTAAENVELPLRLARVDVSDREARVRGILALVGLEGHARQRPPELSGGQQQRVAIARALVHTPAVLLADEPTAQLDSATAAEMMTVILARVRAGAAALVTTHDPAVVELADRVLELHDGRLRTAAAGPASVAPAVAPASAARPTLRRDLRPH